MTESYNMSYPDSRYPAPPSAPPGGYLPPGAPPPPRAGRPVLGAVLLLVALACAGLLFLPPTRLIGLVLVLPVGAAVLYLWFRDRPSTNGVLTVTVLGVLAVRLGLGVAMTIADHTVADAPKPTLPMGTPAGYVDPNGPAPSNPVPNNPVPSNSVPSNSAPGNSAPGNSAPADSVPDNSSAGNSVPSEPVPSDPGRGHLGPGDFGPNHPAHGGPARDARPDSSPRRSAEPKIVPAPEAGARPHLENRSAPKQPSAAARHEVARNEPGATARHEVAPNDPAAAKPEDTVKEPKDKPRDSDSDRRPAEHDSDSGTDRSDRADRDRRQEPDNRNDNRDHDSSTNRDRDRDNTGNSVQEPTTPDRDPGCSFGEVHINNDGTGDVCSVPDGNGGYTWRRHVRPPD